ncbi:Synaptic vesicle transporter SVOP and related transporters (major facilitator superfamily) [Phaffia rhodozyma]|uniref:Synaptic vesicle transporter SVOP and related transporters (Major facilitator superfamily) n=1 Tax=Phaffia rhodozyma TaxID=264483 RepID=A0A0F7ST29_PHARH|nr:Synaptic vesicle transporter SVOP and related transporters (major facilitator superfamily) [Phaffia rhodozyma]
MEKRDDSPEVSDQPNPEAKSAPPPLDLEAQRANVDVPLPQTDSHANEKKSVYPKWVDDPENPLNWPTSKKWRVCLIVSVTGLLSTLSSSMVAPAGHQIAVSVGSGNVGKRVETLLTVIYVLGLGFGPFIFSPIAELFGRQVSYILSTVPYALLTASCIVAPNLYSLIILRFFCGICGSSGPTLGVATVSDVFSPAQRGKPISIYALGPMAGPVMGSMFGGWLSLVGYRWIFGTLTIMTTLNCVAIVLFMEETYATTVKFKLEHRRKTLQAKSAVGSSSSSTVCEEDLNRKIAFKEKHAWIASLVSQANYRLVFLRAFTRPFRFLFTNPVLAIFALYYSYIYGVIYLLIIALPILFSASDALPGLFSYGWSSATFPLAFLSLGLGFFSAAFLAATMQASTFHRYGDNGQPEYRLVLTQIGMIFFPIGWFIFAWTAHSGAYFICPMIGLALGGFGLMLAFNSIQNFVVDLTSPYSAAGTAAISFSRSIVACVLPVFGPDLFQALGWNWGGSLLAFLSMLVMFAPLIMFLYGKQLRERFQLRG